MRLLLTIGLTLAASSLLAGCGQKGMLYRESPAAAPATSQAPADQAPDVTGSPEQNARPESK